jgi:anthranilate synthase component 1
MIRPLKADFAVTAKKGKVFPVMKELTSDQITPVDAYYASGASYLLESAERGMQLGRYSFLGVEPCARIEVNGNECIVTENGVAKKYTATDPLRVVRDFLNARHFENVGDLSPFPGGAVGYIGYEMVSRFEKIHFSDKKPSLEIPESIFIVTRYTLVFDNLMHTLKIICNVETTDNPDKDYDKAVKGIEEIEKKILKAASYRPSENPKVGKDIQYHYDKSEFIKAVDTIKKYITRGDAIQVVLSQKMSVDFDGDPFYIYRALRSINPSPYMFYLNFDGFVIFGASPEVMVKVEKGKALLRPIAGTRPRGKNAEEDEALARELLADEKERAEHIMLVDLGRNDLGRVAKPGTVKVSRMMDIEMYSHVMHIVSEVTAELPDGVDSIDVIKATFPAGTVSGAPKVRAMEIIEEIEPDRRNHYAGLVGYFSYSGNFDSCIAIRTAAVVGKKLYLQAGAGIVYDSVPEREYDETIAKARAIFEAINNGRI